MKKVGVLVIAVLMIVGLIGVVLGEESNCVVIRDNCGCITGCGSASISPNAPKSLPCSLAGRVACSMINSIKGTPDCSADGACGGTENKDDEGNCEYGTDANGNCCLNPILFINIGGCRKFAQDSGNGQNQQQPSGQGPLWDRWTGPLLNLPNDIINGFKNMFNKQQPSDSGIGDDNLNRWRMPLNNFFNVPDDISSKPAVQQPSEDPYAPPREVTNPPPKQPPEGTYQTGFASYSPGFFDWFKRLFS